MKMKFLENIRKRRQKAWSKKQKLIFLSIFAAMIIYAVISMLLRGEGKLNNFSLPSLNLSINGFDVAVLIILACALAFLKLRSYIKHKKEEKK